METTIINGRCGVLVACQELGGFLRKLYPYDLYGKHTIEKLLYGRLVSFMERL
jgi:hypothetical protein